MGVFYCDLNHGSGRSESGVWSHGGHKMLAAFETAADWREQKAMDSAFAAISWEDASVKAALPEYLAASGAERAKVDYAFNAMVPRPPQGIDGRQAVIHTCIKARLFSY